MTNPVLNPTFAIPNSLVPTLPTLQLSEDEARLANWMSMRLFDQRPYLQLRGLYYDGMQKMQDLGISIPPSLVGLRTVLGWAQIGVDAIEERCNLEGFRYPGARDVDDDLQDIWQSNNMDLEHNLAQLDALIYGRAYLIAGPSDTGGQPLITAESPVNMTAIWDARMRTVKAALQIYLSTDFTSDTYGQEIAVLYLPDKTVYMARQAASPSSWEITERDNHALGAVPVVRLANRQRLTNRDGLSEITPAWMNVYDSACRTALGMEVGREFHAAPRRWVVGAAEDAFVKADGTPASAWDTYLGKIWGLERDDEGNLPQVGEFKTGDPKAYTELLDTYARIMAAQMSLPPEYLGITTNGNPASADAIRQVESRLIKRVERKTAAFSEAWEQTMRLALLIRDGALPAGAMRLETEWANPATPTPGATTDAVSKQVAAGIVPATSDVVLRKLGYTPVERDQLEADRQADAGTQFLLELSKSLESKAARTDVGLTRDLGPQPKQVTGDSTGPSQQ